MTTRQISDGLRAATKLLDATYNRKMPGVTIAQLAALNALAQSGPVHQLRLAKLANSDRSSVAIMVYLLETRGFVTRRRKPGGRDVLVNISPAGRKVLRKADRALEAAERAVLEFVAAGDRALFEIALTDIRLGCANV